MSEGNSISTFAASIGCGISTLYDWFNRYPEFLEAKEIGITASLSWWEDVGKKMAVTNPSIYIFQMKNRFGWKHNPPNDHPETINCFIRTPPPSLNYDDLEKMTPEELWQTIEKEMKGKNS